MDVLIYLLPIALGLGFLGLIAFLWSLRSGQFDDLEGSAWRPILDDTPNDPRIPGRPARPSGDAADQSASGAKSENGQA